MYPKNQYLDLVEKKINNLELKELKHLHIVQIQKFLQVKLKI